MATIRDVANRADVSTATVSNVLHARRGRVRPETRERVLAAIRDLRYRPTALESGQAAILTHNIGLMVTDLTNNPILRHDYFRYVLDGVMEAAMFRGWSVTIFTETMWDDLGTSIRRSYDGRCDGVILLASEDHEAVGSLLERGVPTVLIGSSATLPGLSSVDIDNETAGALAAGHLVDLGHRRFAFVGAGETLTASERERGFRQFLFGAGFCGEDYRVYPLRPHRSLGEVADHLIAAGPCRPTGIFAWHDQTAFALIEALAARGVQTPRDYSIVGVNGFPNAETTGPALTTISQPLHSIGKRAASLLIDRLTDPIQPAEVVRFSVELRLGGTTGLPPREFDPVSLSDIAVLSS